MKRKCFLFFTLLISSLSYGQIIITELADPNNNLDARYIELYNSGGTSVDFTEGNGWQIDKYTNASGTVSQTLDLTGTIAAGGFYIIATGAVDTEIFDVYAETPDQWDLISNGPAGSNGDDKIALVDGNDVIVDIFGNPGDDSNNANDAQNFEDGRAERKASVTTGVNSWSAAEWNVDNDQNFGSGAQDAPGGFDPRSWIGVAGTCLLSLSDATFTCSTNTFGDDNDTATVNIAYTGFDATITSVTTTSGGSVGGDNPASVADGTITISGLSEGSTWDITVNGGNCDGTTTSGTIHSTQCDPSPLVINELLADPAAAPNGDANGDGTRETKNDEFVEIYNITANPVDMEGFTLSDGVVRHTFTSTVIPAHSFITVFGGGTPTDIDGISQIASTGQLGLTNGGDTMTLKNDNGIILDELIYGSEGNNNESLAREPDFTGAFLGHKSHANSREFSPGLINDTVLSTRKNKVASFSIYPNPVTSGFFTINSANGFSKYIQVYNLLGKQVYNKTVQNNERINVTNLNAGMYILKVEEEGKLATRKLIIE